MCVVYECFMVRVAVLLSLCYNTEMVLSVLICKLLVTCIAFGIKKTGYNYCHKSTSCCLMEYKMLLGHRKAGDIIVLCRVRKHHFNTYKRQRISVL